MDRQAVPPHGGSCCIAAPCSGLKPRQCMQALPPFGWIPSHALCMLTWRLKSVVLNSANSAESTTRLCRLVRQARLSKKAGMFAGPGAVRYSDVSRLACRGQCTRGEHGRRSQLPMTQHISM